MLYCYLDRTLPHYITTESFMTNFQATRTIVCPRRPKNISQSLPAITCVFAWLKSTSSWSGGEKEQRCGRGDQCRTENGDDEAEKHEAEGTGEVGIHRQNLLERERMSRKLWGGLRLNFQWGFL